MLYLDSAQKNPSAQQASSTTGYSLDLFHTRTTRKLLKKHFHEIRFYDNIKAWIYVLWKNTKTEYISYIMFDTIILLLLVKLSKVEGKLYTFLVFYLFMFTVQLLLLWQCHCCIRQSWFFNYQRGISALDMLFPFKQSGEEQSAVTYSQRKGVYLSCSLTEVVIQLSSTHWMYF